MNKTFYDKAVAELAATTDEQFKASFMTFLNAHSSDVKGDKTVTASVLIAKLEILVKKHGDKPVLFASRDEGAFDIDEPRFDSDGAGDDCFLI